MRHLWIASKWMIKAMKNKVLGEWERRKAYCVYKKVYSEEILSLISDWRPSDLLFKKMFHESCTEARTIDVAIFVGIVSCFMAMIASLLSLKVSLIQIMFSDINKNNEVVDSLDKIAYASCIMVIVAIALVIWHLISSRSYQKRKFVDLLYESMVLYLSNDNVPPRIKKQIKDEWSKLEFDD